MLRREIKRKVAHSVSRMSFCARESQCPCTSCRGPSGGFVELPEWERGFYCGGQVLPASGPGFLSQRPSRTGKAGSRSVLRPSGERQGGGITREPRAEASGTCSTAPSENALTPGSPIRLPDASTHTILPSRDLSPRSSFVPAHSLRPAREVLTECLLSKDHNKDNHRSARRGDK